MSDEVDAGVKSHLDFLWIRGIAARIELGIPCSQQDARFLYRVAEEIHGTHSSEPALNKEGNQTDGGE